jgi:two-component system, OmpR family, catabolic regulation response regulator CreB
MEGAELIEGLSRWAYDHSALDKPLILIVDDEPSIADTVQYALRTEGFDPLCSTTGADALRQLDTQPVALVLLDVGLPDINGFEVYKRARAAGSEVPVVFLTARGQEIDRVVGLELGADDYVTKPFSPRELVARVRSVLRRTSSQASSRTDSESRKATKPSARTPFVVDDGRKQIRYCGQLLDLSRYEYGLLKTLVGRPGIVFTRDQLLDMVWDDATESLDRTVDAHVKTLRAKLRAVSPEHDAIRTHRGSGYALSEDWPASLLTQ